MGNSLSRSTRCHRAILKVIYHEASAAGPKNDQLRRDSASHKVSIRPRVAVEKTASRSSQNSMQGRADDIPIRANRHRYFVALVHPAIGVGEGVTSLRLLAMPRSTLPLSKVREISRIVCL